MAGREMSEETLEKCNKKKNTIDCTRKKYNVICKIKPGKVTHGRWMSERCSTIPGRCVIALFRGSCFHMVICSFIGCSGFQYCNFVRDLVWHWQELQWLLLLCEIFRFKSDRIFQHYEMIFFSGFPGYALATHFARKYTHFDWHARRILKHFKSSKKNLPNSITQTHLLALYRSLPRRRRRHDIMSPDLSGFIRNPNHCQPANVGPFPSERCLLIGLSNNNSNQNTTRGLRRLSAARIKSLNACLHIFVPKLPLTLTRSFIRFTLEIRLWISRDSSNTPEWCCKVDWLVSNSDHGGRGFDRFTESLAMARPKTWEMVREERLG